ncbi:cytochrome-c peroxidase [Sulfurimonas paralvinellae]|uniref:C-type cytochrome n=1 Tax=Sulfurimonas paralvinellae TaxID=317658 RepID=A0A7M1B7A1_9BACT|nr:cytochrome c peroxidase [Sulfurimonas paralvinellae]QOP45386.1 c-type cytochrome [Sulfurimonas paralvinellae]
MLRLSFLAIIIIIAWIEVLPYLIPKKPKKSYNDEQLREIALSRGMRPIPKEYDTFLKLLDSKENPITKAKVALGKKLFFDKLLSSDKTISCASCHLLGENPHNQNQFSDDMTHPQGKTDCMVCHIKDESGSDRLSTAIGVQGRTAPNHLNTPTILNSALAKYRMWDGSAKTSLDTIAPMIHDKYKMNLTSAELVKRLNNNTFYKQEFAKVFKNGVTFENVQKALDIYQKTLLTRSAYDRFLEGDNQALSEEAKRGFRNFIQLGCKGCHTGITVGGQTIQKFPARNYNHIIDVTGMFSREYIGRDVAAFNFNFKPSHRYPFENKGGYLGKDNKQLFRVPILRNVTKTSPYFHNGSVFDLREAVHIMGKYQLSMELTETQIDEIVAFLKSLDGEVVEYKELK